MTITAENITRETLKDSIDRIAEKAKDNTPLKEALMKKSKIIDKPFNK